MKRIREAIQQIKALFRSAELSAEIDAEIEQHLEFMLVRRTTALIVCTMFLAATAPGQPARKTAEAVINKGAAVPREVLDAYPSLAFNGMPYRLLLPASYDATKKYPLILSLHGRAGVGNDNVSQMRRWTSLFVDSAWRAKHPCIVVAPQALDSWNVDGQRAPALTDEVLAGLSDAWKKRLRDRPVDPEPVVGGPLTKAPLACDPRVLEGVTLEKLANGGE